LKIFSHNSGHADMRIVIAIGGNALLQRGQPMTIEILKANINNTAKFLSSLAIEHQIIITFGNGPQIGLLSLQALAYSDIPPYPLDVLGAESQGMIGYLLVQSLLNHIPERKCVSLFTQVEVDENDIAFEKPTKFIGPIYTFEEANDLAVKFNWKISKDGNHFRRVIPSPIPKNIIEIETIRQLVTENTIVICAGGGGVPVIKKDFLLGIEAVIDKDFTSALLAEQIEADRLILLTDVSAVMKNWGTPSAEQIRETSVTEIMKYQFPPGSMLPKVTAACQFVEKTKKIAQIGALNEALKVVYEEAGTKIFYKL
jgi:carbamate kinase